MTVIDVSDDDFAAEVIARSRELPVVVDFWAPWCRPCRQLGPVLEQAANARDGEVVLAKVDTDRNPRVAQRYGIQGIPAVKAFVDGEVSAEFVGALPPTQVEAFFDALAPSEAQQLVAAGDEASLRRALELEPANADAHVALAVIEHRNGDADAALARARNVAGSFRADGLVARIELERAQLPTALDAFALLDAGDVESGLDRLLDDLAAANGDDDTRERLRRVVVAVLDELGVEHQLARDARRRLAAALY